MATRLYFDPTNTPDVSPAYSSQWALTADAVRRKMYLDTPGDTASSNFTVAETAAVARYVLAVQFVSEPLNAYTENMDLWQWAFRCMENAAKADAKIVCYLRKCDGDGANPVDLGINLHGTECDDVELVNRFVSVGYLTGGEVSQGDRLIIEVGFYLNNTKTDSYSGTVNITDNHATTDLPENDTETAAYNCWAETGATFTEASGEPAAIKLGPMFAFA